MKGFEIQKQNKNEVPPIADIQGSLSQQNESFNKKS